MPTLLFQFKVFNLHQLKMPTTKIVNWVAISLLGFMCACSNSEQPQAAPPPKTEAKTQASSPAASMVKRLLETKKCFKCDLEGANLQGADLQGADLSDALLQGANLQGANLTRADLEEAILKNANLQGANLNRANLEESLLKQAKERQI